MRSFRDREGRAWDVDLTVDALKAIKAEAGLSLLDFDPTSKDADDPFRRLTTDPVVLADTLCALCRPQLEKRMVSDRDFGRALGGDAIEAALIAIVQEWADFFRQRGATGKATLLDVLVQSMLTAKAKMNDAVSKVSVEEAVDRLFSRSPTNSPESSESTPAPSPSAN